MKTGEAEFEIESELKEIYGVGVSPSLISAVTDSVLEGVKAWQSRPLDAVYPVVYLEANGQSYRLRQAKELRKQTPNRGKEKTRKSAVEAPPKVG